MSKKQIWAGVSLVFTIVLALVLGHVITNKIDKAEAAKAEQQADAEEEAAA
jgi:hypothetical protein